MWVGYSWYKKFDDYHLQYSLCFEIKNINVWLDTSLIKGAQFMTEKGQIRQNLDVLGVESS